MPTAKEFWQQEISIVALHPTTISSNCTFINSSFTRIDYEDLLLYSFSKIM